MDETNADKVYTLAYAENLGGPSIFLSTFDFTTGSKIGSDVALPYDTGITNPKALAVNSATQRAYALGLNGRVAVIDLATRSIITSFEALGVGDLIAANRTSNKIYVIGDSKLAIINGTNNTVAAPPAQPDISISAILVNSNTNKIYLLGSAPNSGGQGKIVVLDGTTDAIIDSFALPASVGTAAIDIASNTILEADAGMAAIRQLNASNGAILQTLPYHVDRLAVTGSSLYVIDHNQFLGLGLISLTNGSYSLLPTSAHPGAVVLNATTNKVYALDETNTEVYELDGATHALTHFSFIPPPADGVSLQQSRGIAVSEALNRVYVTVTLQQTDGSYDRSVKVFNAATHSLVTSIPLSAARDFDKAGKLAVDDPGHRAFVAVGSNLVVVHLDSNNVVTTLDLEGLTGGLRIASIAVNRVTNKIYLDLEQSDEPSVVLDGTDFHVLARPYTGNLPDCIAINEVTNKIYFANTGAEMVSNTFAIVDGATDTLERLGYNTSDNSGNSVDSVAVNPQTNILYLTDQTDGFEENGYLNVFNLGQGNEFIGQVQLGRYPSGLAVNPNTQKIFVANNDSGSISVLAENPTTAPAKLVNISTRMRVEAGNNVLIGGFILTGPPDSSKRIAVRAIGPSLGKVGVPGTLSDPILELYDGAGNILDINDSWLEVQAQEIQANSLAPGDEREAVTIRTLAPGNYTAVVKGSHGETGVGLVEAYDLTQSSGALIANISTRGRVLTADNVMIGGFILAGANPTRIVVRAIGPSLSKAGVTGTLNDPTLELHDGQGALLQANDDWRTDQEAALIAAQVPPSDNRESAILATLKPGNYTAIVRGKDNTTGVAVVEAYNLQ